ncbi:hypothetical protein [Afipia carboxidovorans]|uniref:hypothetical protein n=1 Tax=Afipia carboxidovorans TaxID=40137 RepID=UPI0030CD4DBF
MDTLVPKRMTQHPHEPSKAEDFWGISVCTMREVPRCVESASEDRKEKAVRTSSGNKYRTFIDCQDMVLANIHALAWLR